VVVRAPGKIDDHDAFTLLEWPPWLEALSQADRPAG
jgi:hypothetical protein